MKAKDTLLLNNTITQNQYEMLKYTYMSKLAVSNCKNTFFSYYIVTGQYDSFSFLG